MARWHAEEAGVVEFLELVLVEEDANLRLRVEERCELGAVGGGGVEERELAGEVLEKAAESLKLARDVDHPLFPVLKLTQGLVLEPVSDDPHTTLLQPAGAKPSDGVPEDLLRVLGGHTRVVDEDCVAKEGSAVGEVGGEADDGVGGGERWFPAMRGELEEERVAETSIGVEAGLVEAGVQERAGEVAGRDGRKADLV